MDNMTISKQRANTAVNTKVRHDEENAPNEAVKTSKVKNSLAVSKSKDGLTTNFKRTTTLIKDEPSIL